jgi:hypothetical protein
MPLDQPPSTGANTLRLFGALAVMTTGVAATLATVLGFFGSFWWFFDVLAGYRLQLAVILLAVAAGFRVGFGLATGILFFAAAVTNVVIVYPLFFGSAEPVAAGADKLTIASIPVTETGQQQALDFIARVEVDEETRAVELAYESGVDIAFLLDTDDTWTGLSPVPETGYVTVDQVFYGRQTGITVIAREGLDVVVEGLGDVANSVVRVETTLGDNALVIYAVNFSSPGSDTQAAHRERVINDVVARISTETTPVALIGGLATSPWSHAFDLLAGDADLTDSSPGHGFQGSSPGSVWIGFRVPTHHLLHSAGLTSVERHLGPDMGSGQRVLQAVIAPSAG